MTRHVFRTSAVALTTLTLAFAAAARADETPRLMLAPSDDQELLEPELELPRMGFYSQFVFGRGAYVTGVMHGTEAAKLGLEEGDIVVGINGQKLKTPSDWNAIIHDVLHHHDEDVLLHGAEQTSAPQTLLKPKLKLQHEHIITLHIRDWRTGHIAVRKTNLKHWE